MNLKVGETYVLRNDPSFKFYEDQNIIENVFSMVQIENIIPKL